jgi:hypothetical protein
MTGLILLVLLFLVGALSAPAFLTSKVPAAKPMLDKLEPHQPWIGVAAILLGLYGLISTLRFIAHTPLLMLLVSLATAACMLGLGFLLGFPILSKALAKNPAAAAKGELLRLTLMGYREKLGILAMGLAVLFVILTLLAGVLFASTVPTNVNVTFNAK